VRLLKKEKDQIKLLSMATVALFVWRALIVGSRILIFLLFALIFRYWIFVFVGFHYLLMFVLVSYQMRLTEKNLLRRILYIIATPLIYIFDFCVNWLHGPTFYWYLICYVPMYCENLLMAAMVLRFVDIYPTLSPFPYTIPACVCVIVMFPLGVLAQLGYYRFWHPRVRRRRRMTRKTPMETSETAMYRTPPPSQVGYRPWSEFRDKVIEKNRRRTYERYAANAEA